MSKEMPPRVWVTPEWKDIGKGIHRHLAFTRPDYERHELGVPYVPEKSVEEALSLARTQARAEAFEEVAKYAAETEAKVKPTNYDCAWGYGVMHLWCSRQAAKARSSSGGEG